MIEIPLSKGKVALVDDCDAHLTVFKWHVRKKGYTWYAQRTACYPGGRRSTIHLHREVLGVTDPAVQVDHRDGNGLDCRRHNLRAATNQQNGANRGPQRNNTSGFKGVMWAKQSRRWRAQIRVRGRKISLGEFNVIDDAARAYDRAALEAFGAFARLNFPPQAVAHG